MSVRSFEETTRESVEVDLDFVPEESSAGLSIEELGALPDSFEAPSAEVELDEDVEEDDEDPAAEQAAVLERETAAVVEPLPRETGDDTTSGTAEDVVVPEVADAEPVVAPELG